MNEPVEIQCLASATFEEFLAQAGGSAGGIYISVGQGGDDRLGRPPIDALDA